MAGLAAGHRHAAPGRRDLVVLALIGVVAGFAFGVLMDVWDRTFFAGSPGLGWVPGVPLGETLARFARFYLLTSLAYDSFRAVGNAVLVLVLGAPILAALARLRARLSFEIADAEASSPAAFASEEAGTAR